MARGLRNVFANLGWLVASRGAVALFSLIYLGLATRSLGLTGFGQFALILSASQTIVGLVSFQAWQIVVKYGVRWISEQHSDGLARLVRGCCLLDLGSALIGAVLATTVLATLGPHFGLTPKLIGDAILFSLALLLALRSTPLGILRLHDRFAMAAAAETVAPAMRLAGAVVAVLVEPSIRGFLIAWAIAEIATAAAYWSFAWRSGELKRALEVRVSRATLFAENPGFVRFAAASNLGSTLNLASKQVAVLLVGLYAGPAAAGAYRLAHQLAQAIAKLSQMLARAAFPELVRAMASADDHAAALLRRLTIIATLTAAGAFLVLIFVGRPLLGLVGGDEYRAAFPLLLLLGIAGCIDFAAATFEPMLLALGRAGRALLLRLLATVMMLGLQPLLLEHFGVEGAAAAVLTGSVVAAFLLALAATRSLRAETVARTRDPAE